MINSIQLIFFIAVLIYSCLFLIIQLSSHRDKFKRQSEYIQTNYTEEQKSIVKREVERVVELINLRMAAIDDIIEDIVREKVNSAHAIAENIYLENRNSRSRSEITKMIKDALRPVRFEGDQGYYFVTSYSGLEILFADRPELEGKNLLNMQDTEGRYVIRDMIDISRTSGEGLYEYLWTRPGYEGDGHRKISYIKHFEPYDWIIGTGLYIDDVMARIQLELLEEISDIRFGQEGYIFINTLDAYALVANGKLLKGDKKLWEVFDKNPEKTRDLFRKEYDAAVKPEGDFIYYSIQKLSDSTVESPKTSFIFGIPRLNWLIGAGIYLDDVDREISALQEISSSELLVDITETILFTILLIGVFLFVFFMFGKRIRRDFYLFTDFFEKAASDNIEIDLQNVRFREFSSLAESANSMQIQKIRAQENLKISESKFRLLAENSKDMIFRMSFPDGVYDYISPASLDILGYTPREIMEEPFHIKKSIHPDWKQWLDEKLENIARGYGEDSFEYMLINKAGEEVWVTQKNTFIRNEKGEIRALIGRISDDTKRKRMEEQLSQNYRMDAIGKLAGSLAHDFNNILAGILNAANVLNSPKREIDEKGKRMVDLIMKAAGRAADLTSKLSTFSRKRNLILKPQDIHHIIDETAVILKRIIGDQISLKINNNAEKSVVIGDGTELQSAILNLGINASHAISGTGEICISTADLTLDQKSCDMSPFECSPGEYVRIDISDTGSGISPDILKHIFEPFFSTKKQGKGTGLGLATVYGIILDHHGIIEVDSEEGSGTVFTLLFPGSGEEVENVEIKEDLQEGTGCILFVDDEEFIREAGKDMLEDMGYTVFTAENGKIGVDIYSRRHSEIDLVIMDITMPEMKGTEAFEKMKEINRDCKIIMISGFTREEDLAPLREAGMLDFIRKPFTDIKIGMAIERALRVNL